MERNTKILIGLAAAGVVAYLVFKPKNPTSTDSGNANSFNLEQRKKYPLSYKVCLDLHPYLKKCQTNNDCDLSLIYQGSSLANLAMECTDFFNDIESFNPPV
jgi:hypothetical protein